MSKCVGCGASWTTSGLALCPMCGTGVEQPAVMPGLEIVHKTNGTAVLERKTETKPEETPPPARDLPPLRVSFFPRSDSRSAVPGPVTDAPVATPALKALLSTPSESSSEAGRTEPEKKWADASAIFLAPESGKPLPRPARPLNAPLVLGLLSLVSALMLPVTAALQGHRIYGILGFCMTAFFLPFSPIAWISGLSAEKRRREQGLRPERRVVVGRLLGQGTTLLIVAELAVALVLIAALRLSGRLPMTIWACEGVLF